MLFSDLSWPTAAFFAVAAFGAAVVTALAMRVRIVRLREQLAAAHQATGLAEAAADRLHTELQARTEALAAARESLAAAEQRAADIVDLQQHMPEIFRSVSTQVIQDNNRAFLDLARTALSKTLSDAGRELDGRHQKIEATIKPVETALTRFDQHVHHLEQQREQAYGHLNAQVANLNAGQQALGKETARLVQALREPHVRGRWGELTLQRVAELAGMQERCDFIQQASAATDTGTVRPDMIVHLPGNRRIVIDAKVPLVAYLNALSADGDDRDGYLSDHARHVRQHVMKLAQKQYWSQFQPSPEFVVLFIPGENFFSAALEADATLIETGAERGVILATPTTLIALLKTVAIAWRQSAMAENARKACELGAALYERLTTMSGHMGKMGKSLDNAVDQYNRLIGSYERRVLAAARQFQTLDIVSAKEPDTTPTSIDRQPRPMIDRDENNE